MGDLAFVPVLIAEDDHEIREALEGLLSEAGYRVHAVADGRQAVALLRRTLGSAEFPRLLLLDMMMPVMNGWEVLVELRSDPGLSALRVVVVSASNQLPTHGVHAVLRKPVQAEELLDVVRTAVS